MIWTSLQEIIDEFDLEASIDDPSAIAAEIRIKLASAHPDKSGGEFTNELHKEEYSRLHAASDWLETQSSGSASNGLISIYQLPALIKSIQDLQRPPHYEKVESLIRDTRFEAQLSRKSVYGFPRISSGAIAAITGLLAAFPEKFSRIFSSHAQTNLVDTAKYAALLAEREQILSTFFLVASIFAGILFCITWLSERRYEELTESAMSSAAREELFRELVYQLGRNTYELKFSTRIFVDLVSSYLKSPHNISSLYRLFVPLWHPKISTIVAEKIALVHLEELENRGVIRRTGKKSLYPTFLIAPEAVSEVI